VLSVGRGGQADGGIIAQAAAGRGTQQVGPEGFGLRGAYRHPQDFAAAIVSDAVGEAGTAFVEDNQPSDHAATAGEVDEAGVLPRDLELGNKALDEDNIDQTAACELVGNG
jgi:hypothetical protein